MKFYTVNGDYYDNLADAKKDARHAAETSYDDVEVERGEVDLNKETVLRLLNNSGGFWRTIDIVYTAKAKLKKSTE